jgi:DNA replication protein DnaC
LDHEFFIDDVTFKTHLASNNLRLRWPEDWGASIDKYPLEALSKKKIVVYDDFGSSEMTEAYITKTLYRLNERKNRDLITIFTTNLGQEKRAEIEPKISSRVLENSATVIIQWPDLRKTGNLVIKIK